MASAPKSGSQSTVYAAPPRAAAKPLSKFAAFRHELTSPDLSFVMEAHNGLSAKIAEETGFKSIWASGLSISAALGVRDSNEASWTQVLEVLEFMSDATSVPILVDGDTGYGNFNNVRRLVRKLCQRNIAAVCIEDKIFPKTNSFIGEGQPLAEIEEFCGKIKAGKDSQLDEDFSLIARVEALISGWGMEEALRRAEAYHRAGADGILIHSKLATADEILAFTREWANRCPIVIVPTMYYRTPTEAYRDAGISMVIWANHNLRASITAMREVSRKIMDEQSLANVEQNIASVADIFNLAGNKELADAEKRYLSAPEGQFRSVIIAASRGSKLGPLTEDRPKCMLDVRGQPLLRRLIGTLRNCGVRDVTVVRGYKKDTIRIPSIRTIDNDAYATTGEVASLACAAPQIQGDCILGYGDILFREFILESLKHHTGDIVLAVDALARGKDYRQADRLVDLVKCSRPFTGDYLDDKPLTLTTIANEMNADDVDGEWVGLAKLSKQGSALVRAELAAMRADGTAAKASLLEMFGRIKAKGHTIDVVYVTGHWFDVDDAFDLAKARNLL
ncbi:MAG: phosphoenolpyruvate mutase [Alphaproteobacteria bacterium]